MQHELFALDHTGRPVRAFQSVAHLGAQPRVLTADLAYNELGQLWRKNLHSTDGAKTGSSQWPNPPQGNLVDQTANWGDFLGITIGALLGKRRATGSSRNG